MLCLLFHASLLVGLFFEPQSETSFDFKRTIRRYIPEDKTLHNNCYKKIQSCTVHNTSHIDIKIISEITEQAWYTETKDFSPVRDLLHNSHSSSVLLLNSLSLSQLETAKSRSYIMFRILISPVLWTINLRFSCIYMFSVSPDYGKLSSGTPLLPMYRYVP
jgi:hypothetical protein